MNISIKKEDFERCQFIQLLKNSNYFQEIKELNVITIDNLYQLTKILNKLTKVKQEFENGYISQEEITNITNNAKVFIQNLSTENKTDKIFLKEVNDRIKKVKNSKSPFNFFSKEKKIWNLYKKETINKLKEDRQYFYKYLKTN